MITIKETTTFLYSRESDCSGKVWLIGEIYNGNFEWDADKYNQILQVLINCND